MVGWMPFVSAPGGVFSPFGARFVFRCHRLWEQFHTHHKEFSTRDIIAFLSSLIIVLGPVAQSI